MSQCNDSSLKQARLCCVTDGSDGLALALGRGSSLEPVFVPALQGVAQVDATGAGDAAFGGMLAYVHAKGVPTTTEGLERLGKVPS